MLIAFNRNYSVKKHTELFICSAKRSFFKVRVVTTSNNLLVNFRVVEKSPFSCCHLQLFVISIKFPQILYVIEGIFLQFLIAVGLKVSKH